jgi:hypothetical protein
VILFAGDCLDELQPFSIGGQVQKAMNLALAIILTEKGLAFKHL